MSVSVGIMENGGRVGGIEPSPSTVHFHHSQRHFLNIIIIDGFFIVSHTMLV